LSPKSLEVKILITNGLGRAFSALAAPCAAAMIADLDCEGKVGYHNVAVGKTCLRIRRGPPFDCAQGQAPATIAKVGEPAAEAAIPLGA
jgi:hypothetical protein